MSTLTPVEGRLLESLLEMSGGYVLDFTNASFQEFFRTTVKTDIYSDKYASNGDSKAKRLRAFWSIESDTLVGTVLREMLKVWEYRNLEKNSDAGGRKYEECLKITQRLLGEERGHEQGEREGDFLEKDFGSISMGKLPIEPRLVPILEKRLTEANRCFKKSCPLATIFLCGSMLEGILLGVALDQPKRFNQAHTSPKDKSGKVRPFQEWSLSELIDAACALRLLKLDVKKFSHALRDFRNYIHPYQQMASNFDPDRHTAAMCLQVLRAAIADLSGKRK